MSVRTLVVARGAATTIYRDTGTARDASGRKIRSWVAVASPKVRAFGASVDKIQRTFGADVRADLVGLAAIEPTTLTMDDVVVIRTGTYRGRRYVIRGLRPTEDHGLVQLALEQTDATVP